jgi:hypothetical protein
MTDKIQILQVLSMGDFSFMDRPIHGAMFGLVPSLRARRGLAFSILGGIMKEIPLTQGKVALVDDEDFEKLNKFRWYARRSKDRIYALRNRRINKKRQTEYMHRRVARNILGNEVDHIDHNGLNNQRHNLRICSSGQNNMNQRKRSKLSSKFKGVYWKKERRMWVAQIGYNGQGQKHLGYFTNEESAARVYDAKAKELFGEFASLNFP